MYIYICIIGSTHNQFAERPLLELGIVPTCDGYQFFSTAGCSMKNALFSNFCQGVEAHSIHCINLLCDDVVSLPRGAYF